MASNVSELSSQDCRIVALKSPNIFLKGGYSGRFEGDFLWEIWALNWSFFASKGGSRHRGFIKKRILRNPRGIFPNQFPSEFWRDSVY